MRRLKINHPFLLARGGGDICLLTLFIRFSVFIVTCCVFLLLNEGTRGRELVRES